MHTFLDRSYLAGIGLLSLTREKAQKIVDDLIQRSEIRRDETKDWVDRLIQ